MFFPDELWYIVKNFLIDYKKHHKNKLKNIISHFENNYGEIIQIRAITPFEKNNYISIYSHIKPDLKLSSISYCRKTGNFWFGYGWSKGNSYKRIQKAWSKN